MGLAGYPQCFLLWVVPVGVGRTGRWRCAGDKTGEEGPLDAQLKQRQVWELREGQICRPVHSLMYLFLLEVSVSWKPCCICEAAASGRARLWTRPVKACGGAVRILKPLLLPAWGFLMMFFCVCSGSVPYFLRRLLESSLCRKDTAEFLPFEA